MSEKLVRDLSHEAHFKMQVLLLPPNPGRDWKTLADKMGFPREEILYFECRRDPVLELISSYESKGKTISELLCLLEEMERFDVIETLREFIEATPTSEEKEEWEQRQTEADTKAETISESYDVYIASAKDDQEFVDQIVTILEGPPYCMKTCTDCGELSDTAAKAIKTQCSKVIVVLSESFNRCPDADRMVNFALHLSPDHRKTILIPILYKSCEIPLKLQIFSYLDYTDDRVRKYFWTKLVKSLGHRDDCSGNT